MYTISAVFLCSNDLRTKEVALMMPKKLKTKQTDF